MKKLCVVGGGPKAAALVARVAALHREGRDVPQVTVIERDEVGAAWSGKFGLSNGFLTLCSPAEKDVGYPYPLTRQGDSYDPITRHIFEMFSWSTYLVATGRFADWVDRGREHPSHDLWSKYLAWVFTEAGASVAKAEVLDIDRTEKDQWRVRYREGGAETSAEFDGVLLTGVGEARRLSELNSIPVGRATDSGSFWQHTDTFRGLEGEAKIIVVGGGGSAGAIIAWLASTLAETDVSITCVCSRGTILPRGDGYAERRWFSDPTDWAELPLTDRRHILQHTEEGVISLRNKNVIDRSPRVDYEIGKAVSVAWDGSGSGELSVEVSKSDGTLVTLAADYVVSATGFDPWSLLKLINHDSAKALLADPNLREAAEPRVLRSLQFPDAYMPPGIHVPVLSSLAQGPGMATLGCLGLVAQAVLREYLD